MRYFLQCQFPHIAHCIAPAIALERVSIVLKGGHIPGSSALSSITAIDTLHVDALKEEAMLHLFCASCAFATSPSIKPFPSQSRHPSHLQSRSPFFTFNSRVLIPKFSLSPPEQPPSDNNDSQPPIMHRYQKKKPTRKSIPQEDMLPFDVNVISPPPRHLGSFLMDPRTHCGDIVEYDGQSYSVKSVRLRYRYRKNEGRPRVTKKTLEVKSLARKAIETFLERSFDHS